MSWLVITGVLLAIAGITALSASMLLAGSRRRQQVSMEETWHGWWQAADSAGRVDMAAPLDESVRESVHQSLLELERRLGKEAQPMRVLRVELMDSLDRHRLNVEILNFSADSRAVLRRQHPEILQTDEQAHTYIYANQLRISVLREYAGQQYGDAVDGDWFHVYQKASGLRQRGNRGFIERTLGGIQTSMDEVRFQAMSLMDGEIRRRLLQVPAGTRFPGFGKHQNPTFT
ncbi:MAG: hypothetical protein KGK44_02555 [Gammaproteobacteria bacterium]|nr:hypothetical protein [Gammaproteobacteria bacterium]